jgi:hypothetical protein
MYLLTSIDIAAVASTSIINESNKALNAREKLENNQPYRLFLSTVHGLSNNSNRVHAISLQGDCSST